MRVHLAGLALACTLIVLLSAAPAAGAAASAGAGRGHLDVYAGEVTRAELARIAALGIDRSELRLSRAQGTRGARLLVRVEAILSANQVEQLRRQGIDLQAERDHGRTAAAQATAEAADGFEVFKKYSGPGGLKAEFEQTARENPQIAKLVNYGKSVRGQDIVALKVTRSARTLTDGARPAVLYVGAQHAREWITPEMVRRLMHHIVDGYASGNAEIRNIVNSTELWFVPVANPDGYDWTFEPGQRLWRKNLRDNNRNGQVDLGDGVDLNRNFATKWGYDNEGSSPDPGSDIYRGPSRNSEPETQGLDKLVARVRHEFYVNYHSAAELLLYGIGWQVATPSPDDLLYETMAGDDANPAIPGYDPDISAELYTVNGETDMHLQERYGTLAFTPEMGTCESAAGSVPDDDWEVADCAGNIFAFPDDEALVQAEFDRNLPFALSVAKSADDPDDPESVVGRNAPDFKVDSFDVSYGDPQTVAVVAKRALLLVTMNYRINGGRTRIAAAREWAGGERYGDENDNYYAELRGVVSGARPGDQVEVWFTGRKPRGGSVSSERFTYGVASDTRARVLVLANEDYTGVNPEPAPNPAGAPKYAAQHVAAVEAAGYDADLWNVDAQGVPHDLGVLSHYDAVVWYLGDNRLTQDPEDEFVDIFGGNLFPDLAVAERQQYLTIAVRDFLNEGGKLIHAGELTQYQSGLGDLIGGLYYGLNGNPTAPCVITTSLTDDCLLLADDFRQYYLGAYERASIGGPTSVRGIDDPLEGFAGDLGGPVAEGDNPLDEAGRFVPTSRALPVSQFPQFASWAAADYRVTDFEAVEGQRYAGAAHANDSYMRLTRTVNLPAAASAQLRFKLSLDAEASFDHLIVEAHTVGQNDWTTLSGSATTTNPPAGCGGLLAEHPFLTHYLDAGTCTAPGSSGTWNAMTGSTGGWQEVAFDLTPFLGKQVELSISYVTDSIAGGVGAFVDDTRIAVNANVVSADGFEAQTSTWSVRGEPAGSPSSSGDWRIGRSLAGIVSATATKDSLLLGFGLEQLETDAQRVDLLKRALRDLIGSG